MRLNVTLIDSMLLIDRIVFEVFVMLGGLGFDRNNMLKLIAFWLVLVNGY